MTVSEILALADTLTTPDLQQALVRINTLYMKRLREARRMAISEHTPGTWQGPQGKLD